MSKATKCDRCGGCYEKGGRSVRQGFGANMVEFDLCEDCAAAFEAWVGLQPVAGAPDLDCAKCADRMAAYADSLCDPLKERIAELEAELAKRDKGIERLKRRRGELTEQLGAMADRMAKDGR